MGDHYCGQTIRYGGTENAGLETWDQIAGVEKAGQENAGPNFQGGKRTTTVYGTLNG